MRRNIQFEIAEEIVEMESDEEFPEETRLDSEGNLYVIEEKTIEIDELGIEHIISHKSISSPPLSSSQLNNNNNIQDKSQTLSLPLYENGKIKRTSQLSTPRAFLSQASHTPKALSARESSSPSSSSDNSSKEYSNNGKWKEKVPRKEKKQYSYLKTKDVVKEGKKDKQIKEEQQKNKWANEKKEWKEICKNKPPMRCTSQPISFSNVILANNRTYSSSNSSPNSPTSNSNFSLRNNMKINVYEHLNNNNNNNVFGVDLDFLVARQKRNNSFAHLLVPNIVHQIVELLISSNGYKTNGIFRMCGHHATQIIYEKYIDKEGDFIFPFKLENKTKEEKESGKDYFNLPRSPRLQFKDVLIKNNNKNDNNNYVDENNDNNNNINSDLKISFKLPDIIPPNSSENNNNNINNEKNDNNNLNNNNNNNNNNNEVNNINNNNNNNINNNINNNTNYNNNGSLSSRRSILIGDPDQKETILGGNISIKSEVLPKLDVHTLAELLKCFLRKLPSPIIPRSPFFPHFIQFYGMSKVENRVEGYAAMIKSLPENNYQLLKYLCNFFHLISENKEITLMGASNLGVIFAPAFFGSMDKDKEIDSSSIDASSMCKESKFTAEITADIIAHQSLIFMDDVEPIRAFAAKEFIVLENDSLHSIIRGDSVLLIKNYKERNSIGIIVGEGMWAEIQIDDQKFFNAIEEIPLAMVRRRPIATLFASKRMINNNNISNENNNNNTNQITKKEKKEERKRNSFSVGFFNLLSKN